MLYRHLAGLMLAFVVAAPAAASPAYVYQFLTFDTTCIAPNPVSQPLCPGVETQLALWLNDLTITIDADAARRGYASVALQYGPDGQLVTDGITAMRGDRWSFEVPVAPYRAGFAFIDVDLQVGLLLDGEYHTLSDLNIVDMVSDGHGLWSGSWGAEQFSFINDSRYYPTFQGEWRLVQAIPEPKALPALLLSLALIALLRRQFPMRWLIQVLSAICARLRCLLTAIALAGSLITPAKAGMAYVYDFFTEDVTCSYPEPMAYLCPHAIEYTQLYLEDLRITIDAEAARRGFASLDLFIGPSVQIEVDGVRAVSWAGWDFNIVDQETLPRTLSVIRLDLTVDLFLHGVMSFGTAQDYLRMNSDGSQWRGRADSDYMWESDDFPPQFSGEWRLTQVVPEPPMAGVFLLLILTAQLNCILLRRRALDATKKVFQAAYCDRRDRTLVT